MKNISNFNPDVSRFETGMKFRNFCREYTWFVSSATRTNNPGRTFDSLKILVPEIRNWLKRDTFKTTANRYGNLIILAKLRPPFCPITRKILTISQFFHALFIKNVCFLLWQQNSNDNPVTRKASFAHIPLFTFYAVSTDWTWRPVTWCNYLFI